MLICPFQSSFLLLQEKIFWALLKFDVDNSIVLRGTHNLLGFPFSSIRKITVECVYFGGKDFFSHSNDKRFAQRQRKMFLYSPFLNLSSVLHQ